MKAIQMQQVGDAGVLQLIDLPIPTISPGQALIRVHAAGLNFIDIYIREGRYARPLPLIPGLEASGVVEAIADDVTDVKVGDRVAYSGTIGSYAEYNVVNAATLIPLPDDITFLQGAALPLQGITAQYLLHDFYQIKPGDHILVHAAAGGVGLLLVQWIKQLGGIVIGTVSTHEKAKLVQAAGADHVIVYTEEDFVAAVKKITNGIGADYIIDGVGKTTFAKDLEAAKIYGHICLFGSASGPAEPFPPNSLQLKSLTISGGSIFNCMNSREELLMRANAVIKGMQAGWLTFKIDHVFPLEKASEAQKMLEGRQTMGKVILKIT